MLEPVIENFQRLGLLNDAAFTQGMVNSLRRRGLSAQAIQAKLRAKGLGQDNVSWEIKRYDNDEHPTENGELIAALRLARRKKLGPYRTPDKDINLDRERGALARAGFSYEITRQVLAMEQDDLEKFDI